MQGSEATAIYVDVYIAAALQSTQEYKHRARRVATRPRSMFILPLLPLSHQVGGKLSSIERTPAGGHIIGIGHWIGATVKAQLIII